MKTGADAAAANVSMIFTHVAICNWLGIEPQEAPLCIAGIILSRSSVVHILHVQYMYVVPAGLVEFPAQTHMQFGCSRHGILAASWRHPGGIRAASLRYSCGILVGIFRTYIWVF